MFLHDQIYIDFGGHEHTLKKDYYPENDIKRIQRESVLCKEGRELS